MTSIKIVCFTDIVDSTNLKEKLGSENFKKYIDEHHNICKSLSSTFVGTIIKSTGDGNLITFDDIKNALAFACNIQFFYRKFLVKKESPITIKIGMTKGDVEDLLDSETKVIDIIGSSVNLASRLTMCKDKILVDEEINKSIENIYGKPSKDIISIFNKDMSVKGFDTNQKVFEVNIDNFFSNNHELSFYFFAHSYMKRLGVNFQNAMSKELMNTGTLILPIVPRDNINLIHCGLLEVVHMFSLIDWKIYILIADYAIDSQISIKYIKILNNFLEKRNIEINNVEVKRLSDLLQSKKSCCTLTRKHLNTYLESINVGDMERILKKRYSNKDVRELSKPYITKLRPIYTLAAVRYLLDEKPEKCLVLSGEDESEMWRYCYAKKEEKLGAIHIPQVSQPNSEEQYDQSMQTLYWDSEKILESDMEKNNNIKNWAYKQIMLMKDFPCEKSSINDNDLTCDIGLNSIASEIFTHLASQKIA